MFENVSFCHFSTPGVKSGHYGLETSATVLVCIAFKGLCRRQYQATFFSVSNVGLRKNKLHTGWDPWENVMQ